MEVEVFGRKILGLLDSGATRTISGLPGWKVWQEMGLHLTPEPSQCKVANNQSCACIGYVQVPMTVLTKSRLINILIVPDLPHTLILGIDFWKSMDIVPNLKHDIWHFSNNPSLPEVFSIEDSDSLSNLQKKSLDDLVQLYMNRTRPKIGCAKLTRHIIELYPDVRPIKQRYYPVSPPKQKLINDEIDKMLADNIIEPCNSPWSSPVCLVPKKNGEQRFCIDFRQLNAVTVKDAYPLPYMNSILDQLRDARFLSSLDIKSAYWQVELSDNSKDYTAFTVPGRGLFRFRRMPYGLTNAPATWQRLIDAVLGADLQPSVFVYLDDIIIVSQSFDSHLATLSKVLERLHVAGLTVNFEKCKFCRPELKYLGFVVNKQGLRPDPEKVQAILDIPTPKSPSEIRRFAGTASWFRRFVPNFATVIAPLTELTKRNVSWNWSPECEKSFKLIKECLVTAPILHCPDFNRKFSLQTDASAYGCGAVLSQHFDDGEKVICFLSRSFTSQERKYSSVERECLAVIWAVEKLRHYLEGVEFEVVTDCHSLLWLNRLRDPLGRLARWALRLQPYTFKLIHRKGKDNIVPDMLSRAVAVDSAEISDPSSLDKWYNNLLKNVSSHPAKYPNWRVSDGRLFKYLEVRYSKLQDPMASWKEVVPKSERQKLIYDAHNTPTSGHLGVFKTFNRLAIKYYWPKMKYEIARYIAKCSTCHRTKPEQRAPKGFMLTRSYVSKPWELISADIVGPLPKSSQGFSYILVVTDYFSKFPIFFPLRVANSQNICKHIEDNVFMLFGVPSAIIVDNGVQFRSREFANLMSKYSVRIRFTANYHPQANPTERVNRVLKTMLSSFVEGNQRAWDVLLPKVACAVRSARHEVIDSSPYFVNFGREMILNGEHHPFKSTDSEDPEVRRNLKCIQDRKHLFENLFEDIKLRMQKASNTNAKYYNLRRRPEQFILGQKVYRRNFTLSDAAKYYTAKLAPKFVGPFLIHKRLSSWTYELSDLDGNPKGVWNIKDLKSLPSDGT